MDQTLIPGVSQQKYKNRHKLSIHGKEKEHSNVCGLKIAFTFKF
jgi:hypothetical protein